MPKSVSTLVAGSCGHQYRVRIRVTSAGEPATPQAWAAIEKVLARHGRQARKSHCPECQAQGELAWLRSDIAALCDALGLEPPPPLDGTAAQALYAESLRSMWFWDQRAQEWQAARQASGPAGSLIAAGLGALAREAGLVPARAHGREITRLRNRVNTALMGSDRGRTALLTPRGAVSQQEALTLWLLASARTDIQGPSTAKGWIAVGRRLRALPARDLPPDLVLAAAAVALAGPWPDLSSARQAFALLTSSKPGCASALRGILGSASGMTWADVFDAAAVWDALDGAPTRTFGR